MNQNEAVDMDEWLRHIRGISTRLNRIIGHIVPGATPHNAHAKLKDPLKEVPELTAKCRIVNYAIGWVELNVSYWGMKSVEMKVKITFEKGKPTNPRDLRWDVSYLWGHLHEVERIFSESHLHSGRVNRIYQLTSALAPLFSADRMDWLVGFSILEDLELEASSSTPARTCTGAGSWDNTTTSST